MKVMTCVICGFFYEEDKGLPDHGIPAGTRFEDLPEGWQCAECSAGHDSFELVKP